MQFATCDWNRAIVFLKNRYPSRKLDENKIPKLKKLVQSDVLRIEAPDFHKAASITRGKKYDISFQAEISEALIEFSQHIKEAGKIEKS